jgi:hypothetical protein
MGPLPSIHFLIVSKLSQRLNFLLIMTDQQRGDCLGIDGHPCLLTPTMDAIAGAGARFTHAYSSCPVYPRPALAVVGPVSRDAWVGRLPGRR